MFRKEFIVLGMLALAVLSLVVGGNFWVVHVIRNDASMIAVDTLPGLVDASAAMAIAQANWVRSLSLLGGRSAAERAAIMQQVRTNSTESLWQEYGERIRTSEDARAYAALMEALKDYLKLREEFFSTVEAARTAEANALMAQKLSPAYDRYLTCSQKLFEYNARVGRERAAKVIRVSRIAPFVVGLLAVIVFAFGMLIGLRGTLSGLYLASRFPKR